MAATWGGIGWVKAALRSREPRAKGRPWNTARRSPLNFGQVLGSLTTLTKTYNGPSKMRKSVEHVNILRPRQNGCHFPDEIFKNIFVNENV